MDNALAPRKFESECVLVFLAQSLWKEAFMNKIFPCVVNLAIGVTLIMTGTLSQALGEELDSKQLSNKNMTKSSLLYDREKVEVLARSVTFPEVLNQGELMISVKFPNATILCLEAALYAGRVEGLILAMDRDTVVEHRLYWTIEAADDLYYACLTNLLRKAFADQNVNDRNQLKDIKEDLTGQIQGIQKALRYAQTVKMKADEGPVCVPFTRVPNN
jgi:hypothetical protein